MTKPTKKIRLTFTFLLFMLLSALSFSQDVDGSWIGEISIPNGKLDIAFKIVKNGNNFTSTMDIPKQGLNGAKADSTTLVDKNLTISFLKYRLEYKGSLNDKGEITGNLFQGGHPVSLNLKRGEIKKLNRPQEPKPPFNYYSENITFDSVDNLKLAGTLTLPNKNGKFPVVIIISGSGPQNRDGEMFGHKPYFVIADELTKNGIGVLRFDERGVGESDGNIETATINEFSSDVNSAIGYLKSRKEINTSKIGLIGHSIGGIIAPKVASANNDVSFIILLAGPGINGDKLMLSQKETSERMLGLNDMQIAQSLDFVRGAYDIIAESDLDNPSLKDSINSFYKNKYGKQLPENQRKLIVNQITAYEYVSLIKSKPSEYLSKVKCPVLAINGSKDFQVPAKENLEAIKKILEENGNINVRTVELENLNHLFQECETGAQKEYSEIEQTISPVTLSIITDWIKRQTQ